MTTPVPVHLGNMPDLVEGPALTETNICIVAIPTTLDGAIRHHTMIGPRLRRGRRILQKVPRSVRSARRWVRPDETADVEGTSPGMVALKESPVPEEKGGAVAPTPQDVAASLVTAQAGETREEIAPSPDVKRRLDGGALTPRLLPKHPL